MCEQREREREAAVDERERNDNGCNNVREQLQLELRKYAQLEKRRARERWDNS